MAGSMNCAGTEVRIIRMIENAFIMLRDNVNTFFYDMQQAIESALEKQPEMSDLYMITDGDPWPSMGFCDSSCC